MTELKNLWWKYADEIGESVKRYWKEAKHQRDIVNKLFFSDNKKNNQRNRRNKMNKETKDLLNSIFIRLGLIDQELKQIRETLKQNKYVDMPVD